MDTIRNSATGNLKVNGIDIVYQRAGGLDVRSPLQIAREFRESIPGARLVVIPGCGHVCNLQIPEAFNEAVRNFCRSH